MLHEIAIIGAGKIGRGVVGMLFSRAQWKLHLYDNYAEGMRQLKAQGYYDVRITDGRSADEKVHINDFDIVDSSSSQEIIALLCRVNVAACCVYEGAFESISRVIAQAIQQRVAQGNNDCLNVLLCVNALGAPEKISSFIQEQLQGEARAYFDTKVGICQVMVLAAGIPSEKNANPWQVVVSAHPGLEIDATAWKGERLAVPCIDYVSDAKARMYRKVYCGNMRHAMAGFLGADKGLEFICDCNHDPWIRRNVVQAFEEAHTAILSEFELDPKEDAQWVSFIQAKLDDNTKDPVERVIDKAEEKLSRTNRFVGPALMCVRHHILPFYLTRGIAYGLKYLANTTNQVVSTPEELRAYVQQICGLDKHDLLVRELIEKHFFDIK